MPLPVAWHGLTPGGHIFTTFTDEDGAERGRLMGLEVVPVFADPSAELALLREAISSETAAREKAERRLGDLLAIIHRDGGHHTEAHGVAKSVDDAHRIWAELTRDLEAAAVVEREVLARAFLNAGPTKLKGWDRAYRFADIAVRAREAHAALLAGDKS